MDLFIADRDSQSRLANVITDCLVVSETEKHQWSDMVWVCYEQAVEDNVLTKDAWVDVYQAAETENVAVRVIAGENVACNKKGVPIASKAFSKTWNTNKAILGKALEVGVPIMVDGAPVPKTQLEKNYKEALKSQKEAEAGEGGEEGGDDGTPDTKTDYEKARAVVATLEVIYNKLDPLEQSSIHALLDESLIKF